MNILGLLASITISSLVSFLFAWILYLLDFYEKEPFLLLGAVFIWGAVIAGGGAYLINTFTGRSLYAVTGSEIASNLTIGILVAPVIEEILKGLAVLLVFLVFRKQFDSILDGIIYAGVTALGFAATENALYIYSLGFLQNGWEGFRSMSLVRLGLVGWQHPFYTSFFGIGLALSRNSRKLFYKILTPILGLIAAMTFHSLHNLLATKFTDVHGIAFTTLLDWLGWFAMLIFIIIIMFVEKHQIKKYLSSEIQLGTLTNEQLKEAISIMKINAIRFKALFSRKTKNKKRFYSTAAKLALTKRHLDRLGDEKGNLKDIEVLRSKLKELSAT